MSLSLREALHLALDPDADPQQRRQVIAALRRLERPEVNRILEERLPDGLEPQDRPVAPPACAIRDLDFPDLPEIILPDPAFPPAATLPLHTQREAGLALSVAPVIAASAPVPFQDSPAEPDTPVIEAEVVTDAPPSGVVGDEWLPLSPESGLEPDSPPDSMEPVLEEQAGAGGSIEVPVLNGQRIPFEPRGIISRCLHLYQQHVVSFTLLGIIWTLPGAAMLVLLLPMFGGVSGEDPSSFGAMVVFGLLGGAGAFALASSLTGSLLARWLYDAHVLDRGWQPVRGVVELIPRLPAMLALGFKRMVRLIGLLLLFLLANGIVCSVIDLDLNTPLGRLQRDVTLGLLALVFLWGLLRYSFAETLLVVEGLSAREALQRSSSFVSRPFRNLINLGMLFLSFQILLYLILGSTLTLMEFAPVSGQFTFIVLILSVATLEQAALAIFPLLYIDFKRGDQRAGTPGTMDTESPTPELREVEA